MLCQSVIQTIDSFRRGYDAGIRWGGSAYQPPSFIPAGNRRTRPSGQVPRSFAPARTSRQSGQAPSARPSVTGNDIEEPQLTPTPRQAPTSRTTAGGLRPVFLRNRTRHSQHGSGCRRTAQHSAVASADVFRLIPQRRAQSVGYAGFPASSPAANVSTKFSHLGRPAAATAKTVTARRPRAYASPYAQSRYWWRR